MYYPCPMESNSIIHVLQDCSLAKERVWKDFVPNSNPEFFTAGDVKDWSFQNPANTNSLNAGVRWNTTFGVAYWRIWPEHNQQFSTQLGVILVARA